ncbi:Epoxyqueuosine reductase [Serratia plymuthica]|uniref:Epoxyqueuosine reductase n=1 Tax=Serratia plymuthica TaxID=82996 RepID=A0A2X4TUF8_SERPL|nr:Epoxyqueuosine reductase [Serratia plymuthica]
MTHPPRSQSTPPNISSNGGQSLGFQQVGICDTDLSAEEPKLQAWLDKQYHGEMEWMARHGMLRARPHELLPGTLRVISVRMNYLRRKRPLPAP